MIDIHSHILWGVDDGARTLEESVAMLQMARESGTTDIVATPHADLRYHYRESVVSQRIEELTVASGGTPRIHRGCDFHLTFDNVHEALRRPERFTVNGGPYLMVELPPASLKDIEPVLAALLDRDLIPVITHPERHADLSRIPPELQEWIRAGCLVQITAQSLLGRFGKQAERSAWELIRRRLAHFVASDAHDASDRTPRLDAAYQAVATRIDAHRAQLLFIDNPKGALWGGEAGTGIEKPGSAARAS
jgi:protein-tyrosine phosphatase